MIFRSSILFLTCSFGILCSCDRNNTSEDAIEPPHQSPSAATTRERISMEPDRTRIDSAKSVSLLSKLEQADTLEAKRELFADILLTLPPEDHDLATETIILDLNSPTPARLLEEYLEFSGMLSPALSLPAVARILQEENLPHLQRAAMEQQLRQTLDIQGQVEITNWRPLIESYLEQQPGFLKEDG